MRPHVTVNFAMSADGKLSTRERHQVRISGSADFLRVDKLRAGSDAVMVGIGTVLADDPSLTVKSEELRRRRRSQGKDENPVRVVVDSRGRTPPDAAILHKGPGKRVIGCSSAADHDSVRLLEKHAEVVVAGKDEVDLSALLEALSRMGVKNLMVEGGGTLLWSLFSHGLIDEMYQFIGNLIIGGRDSPTPADGTGFVHEETFARMDLLETIPLDEGILLHWRIRGNCIPEPGS
jgi:2,5-diamino-6-(ribosylamino)-4(3H)-pyrimidinone 5'-phosphate reductase